MFRLSISGPISDSYTLANNSKSMWIRVYRWGSKWGEKYIGCDENDWICETRRQVANKSEMNHMVVLEETQSFECNAPPFDTDDIWDEEVYMKDNITYGNILVLKGNKDELYSICKTIAPSFAEWVREHAQSKLSTPIHNSPKPPLAKPVFTQHARVSKGPRDNNIGFVNQRKPMRRPICLID
jgi:hypothetical protein